MTKDEILIAQKEFLFPSVFHYFAEPLVIERAKSQYVWDADGRQYLDFFGGIVTISVGHCNDRINSKVHAQVDKLQHVSTVFATEPQVALAKKIASITPGGKLTKSFFTNSGTEANETAVVAARYYTKCNGIVAEITRRYGGIFISDEVQTGWGRTGGKWFGIEQWGVTPDVITSAKGLGNGSPIGLTVATPEVADALTGVTISTFGGNPVTTTAAKAVIDFIEEQNLMANCTQTGAHLRGRLEELKHKYSLIGDVR